MAKTLLILAIGVAIGYRYGYADARKHDKTIYERVIDRAGAAARDKYISHVPQDTSDSVGR